MKNIFKDKRILVTGGTGSIGREIVHGVMKFEPKVVRVLDIDETRLFEMEEEVGAYPNARFLLGDVRDKDRIKRAVEGIDIVFHTASLKHVMSCEYNPFEAIKTNVNGTQNLIDVCLEEEVEKFVFTSSDKAVNPISVMGATKLLAERLIISANYYKGARKTVFSNVRFGNVLGSRGSVIPLFKEQIKKGGPVTITSEDMTRFIMLTRQAIDLLFKATELAQGGEIFVFKMKAMRIKDLAEVMIEELATLYGYSPKKILTRSIGIKPGEKLHEELMTGDEARRTLAGGDIFIIPPEMKELSHVEEPFHGTIGQPESKAYTSASVEPLTKEEIKEMLNQENLL